MSMRWHLPSTQTDGGLHTNGHGRPAQPQAHFPRHFCWSFHWPSTQTWMAELVHFRSPSWHEGTAATHLFPPQIPVVHGLSGPHLQPEQTCSAVPAALQRLAPSAQGQEQAPLSHWGLSAGQAVAGFQSPAVEQALSVESLPHFCSPGAHCGGAAWHVQ
jgi:hypothetical protein